MTTVSPSPQTPNRFALAAALFEGSLAVIAVGVGWLVGQPPLATLHYQTSALLIGVVATLPPLLLFWFSLKSRWRSFQGIAHILDDMVIPLFRQCSMLELAIIATLAGVGEEMLFRGVIQPAVAAGIGGPYGALCGLLAASVLFGLLHPMTPAYAVLTGLIGCYLGAIWLACGNLLAPIVIHGLYDFAALAYLIKVRAATQRRPKVEEETETGDSTPNISGPNAT